MPWTHPPYAAEYRRRIVELARAGRKINELAHEFEPSANAIRKWVKQAALDEGLRSDGLTTSEHPSLNRLKRFLRSFDNRAGIHADLLSASIFNHLPLRAGGGMI